MSQFFNFLNRHIAKILWTAAILVWVGVGIYYFSSKTMTKSPQVPPVTTGVTSTPSLLLPTTKEIRGVLKSETINGWTIEVLSAHGIEGVKPQENIFLQADSSTDYYTTDGSNNRRCGKEDVKINNEVIAKILETDNGLIAQEMRVIKK